MKYFNLLCQFCLKTTISLLVATAVIFIVVFAIGVSVPVGTFNKAALSFELPVLAQETKVQPTKTMPNATIIEGMNSAETVRVNNFA